MATTTITVKVKKACHMTIQCEACDHIFEINSYLKQESVQVFANPLLGIEYQQKQTKATQDAKREALQGIEQKTEKFNAGDYSVVDEEKPCPQCGYVQAWMTKNTKRFGMQSIFYSICWFVACMAYAYFMNDQFAGDSAYKVMGFIGGIPAALGITIGARLLLVHPNREWLKKNSKTTHELPPPRMPLKTSVGNLEFGD